MRYTTLACSRHLSNRMMDSCEKLKVSLDARVNIEQGPDLTASLSHSDSESCIGPSFSPSTNLKFVCFAERCFSVADHL